MHGNIAIPDNQLFSVAVRRRRSASVEESKKKEKKDKEKERKRSRSRSKDRRDKDRDRSRYENWLFIVQAVVFVNVQFLFEQVSEIKDGTVEEMEEEVVRGSIGEMIEESMIDGLFNLFFCFYCQSFLFADAVPVLAVQREGETTGTEIKKGEGMILTIILVKLVSKSNFIL